VGHELLAVKQVVIDMNMYKCIFMYTYSHRAAATALRWVGTIVHSFRGLSLWVSFAYMLLFFWRAFSRIKALKMVSRSLLGSLL